MLAEKSRSHSVIEYRKLDKGHQCKHLSIFKCASLNSPGSLSSTQVTDIPRDRYNPATIHASGGVGADLILADGNANFGDLIKRRLASWHRP
jgi:hypothetical protein